MDESKYLIIAKGEDKTSQIVSYYLDDLTIELVFQNSNKRYKYYARDVIIREDPKLIEITDKAVYYNDIPIHDIKQMLNFDGMVKVIFNKGKSKIYDLESLRFENNCITTNAAKSILEYWTKISYFANTEDESKNFLKREYEKLTFVSPNSVLGSYINKQPLKDLSEGNHNIIFPYNFNLSQKQALENALKSNISIIEGPPGTGKTQTILNIIANLAIMQNKTLAVVAGNNAAVQNVRDKLEKDKYGFFVASLGNHKNKEDFFNNLPEFDVSGWCSNIEENVLVEEINSLNSTINYLMDLSKQKAKIQQKLSEYLTEKQHFDIYYDNQKLDKINKLRFYRKKPEKIISFLVDNYLAKENKKSDSFIYKLKLLFKYGFIDFKNLKSREIEIILNLQKEYYELKIQDLENKKVLIQKELDKRSFDDMLKQYQEYSTVLFKHRLYKRYHDRKIQKFNAKSYKRNFVEFIKTFPVVLSTTHSLRNCIPENYLFDYLIIDESSQVDLLSGVLALSCCKNAIIVGDTKQLPHIVDKKMQEKISIYSVEDTFNYLKHNILSSMLALYSDKMPAVILQEHYRCHPKIIGFCNKKYYNGNLIPFTEENENDEPLFLYRTSLGNHMRDVTNVEKRGEFNQREIDVTINEVLKNPKLYVEENSDVGFVTPYRKQVEKASAVLDNEIECDTVHKYQGREKSIMILSTVLDDSKYGRIGVPFVDDPCIINVAVSRAQNKFVLFTHSSLFDKKGKEISDLIKYIEYNTLDKNIITSEIVSIFDLLYKEYSDKLIPLKTRLVQNSKYQSENIMAALLNNILADEKYSSLIFTTPVYLRNLLNNIDKLNDRERKAM